MSLSSMEQKVNRILRDRGLIPDDEKVTVRMWDLHTYSPSMTFKQRVDAVRKHFEDDLPHHLEGETFMIYDDGSVGYIMRRPRVEP